MPEFYMTFARKIDKISDFYMIYAPKKLTKCPNKILHDFCPKNIFPEFWGQLPPAPVSYAYAATRYYKHYLHIRLQTPGDDGSFEYEVGLFAGVEDFDEHSVHVVSLDSVPEQRDENEVVAENVGDATANTRVGEVFSDVEHDQKDGQ